jgi:hypothetical protein
MTSRHVARLWEELSRPVGTDERFQPERLDGLPGAARRYLAHAIAPGARLASCVHLRMAGSIRLGEKWLPFEAEQTLAPPRGFVWRATTRWGWLRFSGADHYGFGSGAVDFRLWGLIPVARSGGPDTSRAARGRLAAESFWLPSSLLPDDHVKWREVDDQTAEVVVELDRDQVPVCLSVHADGKLRSVAMWRWGDQTGDKGFALIPFGGDVGDERRFGDYTIPTTVRVGWWYGTERFPQGEFFRATITGADYS